MDTSPSAVSNKGQKRRIRLFMFIILCFIVWTGYTVYLQSSVLAEKAAKLEEYRQLAEEAELIQQELKYTASRLNDKEYVAELARKNFFLSKPGEVIFVIPE